MGTVGERVKSLREGLGLSRPALARDAGVSYSFLVQVETGQRPNPQADKLAKVAHVLGVSVDTLLAVEEPLPVSLDSEALELRRAVLSRVSTMDVTGLVGIAGVLGMKSPMVVDVGTAPASFEESVDASAGASRQEPAANS